MHSSLIHLIQSVMKAWKTILEVNTSEGNEKIGNHERIWETKVGYPDVHIIVNSTQGQSYEHLNAAFTTVIYRFNRG